MKEKGSHTGGWMYNQAGQAGKTETLESKVLYWISPQFVG